jgi:hypothetical protein
MTVRLVVLLAALLAGCAASGPKYSEVKGSIPELGAEQGRIYFYRPSAVGAAIQPNILLNGTVVGEMVPQGFFYVDRSPGSYLATARTESEATLQIPLAASETKYVRASISLGILVGRPNLMLVDARDALVELADLGYAGTAVLRPGSGGAAPAAAAPSTASGAAPPAPVTGGGTQMKDLEGLLQDRK